MASRLEISLMGPVEVRRAGTPLAVDTRKATALLAYLAVTNRPASRESLAALLWPEADDADARGALRRTLSVLRTALGGIGLAIDRTTVALRENDVDVDLRRFEVALASARDHGHGTDDACPRCIAWLETGAALDRGEFMSGFTLRDSPAFDEWQLAEAEGYRRDLAGLHERLARARAAAGAWDAAIAATRRWLELDPLHEPAHRLLMTIHAQSGEPAAAIHQYRECVRLLDAELAVAPLAETTDLYESIRTGNGPPAHPARRESSAARSLVRSTTLVGRGAELSTLAAVYDGVGPDGRLVVVEGEAGIGKTALLDAFVEQIRSAGGIVLQTRAYPGEDAIAYGPVVDLLQQGLAGGRIDPTADLSSEFAEVARLLPIRGVAGPTPALADDPFGRTRLLEALGVVLPALVGGDVPGALVVDDLHLADSATFDAIAYLARRLAGRPVCLAVSWRLEEIPEDDRRRLVDPSRSDDPSVVTLGRLGREAVVELAAARLGREPDVELVDALFEESEGLPLYLVEALADRTLAGGAPSGARDLLRARIASLDELGTQIVAAASVIGRTFSLRTVRIASGRSEEEAVDGLEELMRRGLVRESDSVDGDVRYDFTHGRLRELVYEELSLARRRLLHGRIAQGLSSSVATELLTPGVRWALVAQHAELAGRTAEAAEAHRRAGEHQMSVFANREAADHFESALALRHPDAAGLHELLGQVLTLQGEYTGAIGHLEAAAGSADGALDPAGTATIEHRLALVHARRGDWSRAESHAAAAVAGTVDPVTRAMVLADRSAIAIQSGDLATAETFAREALELAESGSDHAASAAAEHVLGVVARRHGDLAGAARHLDRAIELSAGATDPGRRVAALNSAARVAAERGDHDRAIELTSSALELCARQGDRHHQAALENNLADLFHAIGREEDSMEHLKRAVALFADIESGPAGLEPEIWKLVEW